MRLLAGKPRVSSRR